MSNGFICGCGLRVNKVKWSEGICNAEQNSVLNVASTEGICSWQNFLMLFLFGAAQSFTWKNVAPSSNKESSLVFPLGSRAWMTQWTAFP